MPAQNHASHFAEETFQNQLNAIWQRGKLLETRRLPGFWLYLYSLDTFFVEMWICQRRYDVSMLRTLASTRELESYISRILLHDLIS